MFSIRAVAVLLAGGLIVGCQTQSHTPAASVAVQPVSEESIADLEQSWRASHPGTQIGHVNAVATDSRIVSATGLPLGDIRIGDVVTILLDTQGSSTVTATVFGKNSGFVQLDYGALRPGQGDPRIGDLVVWYPGGPVAPAASDVAAPPVTPPAAPMPEPAPPAAATPPATPAPAPSADAPPAATPPATPPPAPDAPAPGAATPAPTPPSTDAPPAPAPPAPAPAPDAKSPADQSK